MDLMVMKIIRSCAGGARGMGGRWAGVTAQRMYPRFHERVKPRRGGMPLCLVSSVLGKLPLTRPGKKRRCCSVRRPLG